jgi:hypothetical protein
VCSDHAPLLLCIDYLFKRHKRFHFRANWSRFPWFLEIVERA